MLATLTDLLSNKVKFKWSKTKQDDFEEIKQIVTCNYFLDYPDYNEELKIHTNDSKFQI